MKSISNLVFMMLLVPFVAQAQSKVVGDSLDEKADVGELYDTQTQKPVEDPEALEALIEEMYGSSEGAKSQAASTTTIVCRCYCASCEPPGHQNFPYNPDGSCTGPAGEEVYDCRSQEYICTRFFFGLLERCRPGKRITTSLYDTGFSVDFDGASSMH